MPVWDLIRNSFSSRGPIQFGSGTAPAVLIRGAGFPSSGSAGTGAQAATRDQYCGPGSIYIDTTRMTEWINEGSAASTYWTPTSPDQPGLVSISAKDFKGSDDKAVANGDTSAVLSPSGWTVLGDGVHENDSGAVVQVTEIGGRTPIRLSSSAAASGDLAALGFVIVAAAGPYQPDENDIGILDCVLTNVSAITARILGLGFIGLAPVGFTDPVTGSGTTSTLTLDDMAVMYAASTASDADRFIVAHSKSDDNSSQDYSSLTDLNTGVDMAAAATKQRLRIEIGPVDSTGAIVPMRAFIDKVLVATVANAVDESEELNPVIWISPTTTTIAIVDISRADFYMGIQA